MGNVKVSVIVPVYNVEKYIEKCLLSLVNQTLKDIEIIVVNDGSPDGSQKIIDKYAEKYPSIMKSYTKENGGLGDARNYGIERASGEYIGFVDSDDWVDSKMFEKMYRFAEKEDAEIIICDMIEINDGWEQGSIAYGYRGDRTASSIDKYDFMLNSLNPALACNKLYKAELFQIKKFPFSWYEDMGTTPILLSYANKISYLPIALYYYRQSPNSITKKTNDMRILAVINSWETCLNEVKTEYIEPMEAAIYASVCNFIYFKSEFAGNFLEFIRQNKDRFIQNKIIQEWLKTKCKENLFNKRLIPKKIHYFWFGGNPKSELIEHCMESWKKYAPDFEIIEWNETNCDITINKYVEEAYKAKKWAFVADYFRMYVIENEGGIYLDTDMELMQSPHSLLLDEVFFSFETRDAVNPCIFGALPHNPLIKKCRKSYEKDSFYNSNGKLNTNYTVVKRITELLKKEKLILNGQEQKLPNNIHIYPANKLILDMYDTEVIAQHHYDASWWNAKIGCISYKNHVLRDYFSDVSNFQGNQNDLLSQRDYYKNEFERLEDSTCWRITRPIRIVGDFLKKMFR